MTKKIRKNKAFTLIELVITMSIVMILSAVALPAYHEYVIRAQVVEGIMLAQSLQVVEESYYANNSNFPNLVENHIATPTGKYTSSINVDASNGNITISYGGPSADDSIGKDAQIVLEPIVNTENKTIDHWNCYTQGTLKPKYATECHESNNSATTSNNNINNTNNVSITNGNNGFDNFAKTHKDQLIR
jgi:type IV pilus assembly protein PilA